MLYRNNELPLAVEIGQTEDQLHIYDGLARAIGEPHAVLDILMEAEDRIPRGRPFRTNLVLMAFRCRR